MSLLPKQFWILAPLMLVATAGGAFATATMAARLPASTLSRQGIRMPRPECSWTQLPDGRLLMAGGVGEENLTTVEVFDPKDSTFHPDGPLKAKRCMHSATLLPDGKVLLVGGLGEPHEPWPLSLECYDPSTHRSEIVGQLPKGAAHASAVPLKDGTVFIAGLGYGPNFAARFDLKTGKLLAIGNPMMPPMTEASAVRLDDGEVLLTGWGGAVEGNAFLFDPATNSLRKAGSMHEDRFGHASLLLKDGRVLVAGGHEVRTCEIYDPKADAFSTAGELPAALSRPHMALLPDGKALIVGGREGAFMHNESFLFDPASGKLAEITPPKGFFLMSGILQRPNGDVWLVSDTGTIAKFDAKLATWQ